jgi:hypothetical protein
MAQQFIRDINYEKEEEKGDDPYA